MAITISAVIRGPFFSKNIRAEVKAAIKDTIAEVVLTGEGEARKMAQPSPSGLFHTRSYAASHGYFQTGHYNRSINGRVLESMHGAIADSNVIYGPWLEGVSSRNQTTRFKGYAIFRKTKELLEKRVVGILQKHIGKLRGRLS